MGLGLEYEMLPVVIDLLEQVLRQVIHSPSIVHIVVVQEHLHIRMDILVELRGGHIAVVLGKQFVKNLLHLVCAIFPIHKGIFVNELASDGDNSGRIRHSLLCGYHGCSQLTIKVFHRNTINISCKDNLLRTFRKKGIRRNECLGFRL